MPDPINTATIAVITTGWNDRTILHRAQLAELTSVNNAAYADAIANIHAALRGNPEQARAVPRARLHLPARVNAQCVIPWYERFKPM